MRVLVAEVAPEHAARVNELLRGKLDELLRGKLDELRGQPGLRYAKLARRFTESGDEELVLFEEWGTPADLWAWTGGRTSMPRLLPGTEALVRHLQVTHYETLDVLPEDIERTRVTTSDGRDGAGP